MKFGTPTGRWAARTGTAAAASLVLAMYMQADAGAAQAGPSATRHQASPVSNPYSPAYHHSYRLGAVPTRAQGARMSAWAGQHRAVKAASANNLRYGGGVDGIGVTTGHEKVYLVFFGSQWGTQGKDASGNVTLSGDRSREAPYLQRMFKGLGTNNERWSGTMTQYCQGVRAGAQTCPASAPHVAYPTGGALKGVWVDKSTASPGQATAHRLGQEAVNAAKHFGNTTAAANRNAQYVILSPHGTHPDGFNTPNGQFCAWHDFNGDPGLPGGPVHSSFGDIAFTNMPYVTDAGASCGQDFVNSGGTLDGVSIVEGHEYAETITDQNPAGGWTDAQGFEIADKCAWKQPGTAGGGADLSLRTGKFAMQGMWSNGANGGAGACVFTHAVVTAPAR